MDADMTFDCARGIWFNDPETVRTPMLRKGTTLDYSERFRIIVTIRDNNLSEIPSAPVNHPDCSDKL
jgi:hypothetical protein